MTQLNHYHESQNVTFRVRIRCGVWEVTRDERFFGDYVHRPEAVTAARNAAAAFEATGGSAKVEFPPRDQQPSPPTNR